MVEDTADNGVDGGAEGSVLPGLVVLRSEMARQNADALCSFEAARLDAEQIAARIRATGRVTLLGMGASHWANRMVLTAYRRAGVLAAAQVMSEAMRQPRQPGGVTLLTSQSGGSGEIKAWFERFRAVDDQYGLTLVADSFLARAAPCLIAPVEREQAFAATRSIMVTLALHAAILDALGGEALASEIAPLLDLWRADAPLPALPSRAIAALADCRALYLSARMPIHPVLEATALTFMELARTPALALEIGQLLHGPMETLSPGIALVLARQAGEDAATVTGVAEAAVRLGLTPILFDMSGGAPVEDAVTIPLPALEGLPALATFLPAAQALAIEAAALRIGEGFGTPLRSSKVTDGESL